MTDYIVGGWQISYGKETTPYTETTPDQWIGICPGGVSLKEKRPVKQYYHSAERDPLLQSLGKYVYPFSFEYYPQNGKFLVMALGSVTDSGSGPYTHTIDVADQLPTFTFEAAIPGANFVRRYIGSKIDKITVTASEDDDLKIAIEAHCASIAKYTSATSVTQDTTQPYKFEQLTFTLNAATVAIVKSFSWGLANNVKPKYHSGSSSPTYLTEGRRSNDLAIEINPEDATFWDNWKNQSPTSPIDGNALFTRGTGDTIKFVWSDILYEEPGFELPEEPGEYLQKLVLKPRTCQIIVVDNIATY